MTVVLLEADGRTLRLAAGSGELGRKLAATRPSVTLDQTPSLVAQAGRTRQSVVVNDVTNHPDYWAHPLLTSTRSELVTPLVLGDRLLGTLDVQSEDLNRFSPDDVRVFNILAAQLGVALENAWRFEEMNRFSAELEESRHFLDSIFEKIPTPITVKDATDLCLVRVNKASEQLIGWKAEDVVGKSNYDLFPLEQADLFAATDRELLATGRMVEVPEQHIQTADGDLRLAPVSGMGRKVELLAGP